MAAHAGPMDDDKMMQMMARIAETVFAARTEGASAAPPQTPVAVARDLKSKDLPEPVTAAFFSDYGVRVIF